jgi:replication factor A1
MAEGAITQGALKCVPLLSLHSFLAQHLTILSALFNDPDSLARDFPVPVCQVVQMKTLGSQTEGAPERYRLVLSDIQNFVQSMLATRMSAPHIPLALTNIITEANHVVHDGKLKKGSIVRLKQYQANAVKGKRLVCCCHVEVSS